MFSDVSDTVSQSQFFIIGILIFEISSLRQKFSEYIGRKSITLIYSINIFCALENKCSLNDITGLSVNLRRRNSTESVDMIHFRFRILKLLRRS